MIKHVVVCVCVSNSAWHVAQASRAEGAGWLPLRLPAYNSVVNFSEREGGGKHMHRIGRREENAGCSLRSVAPPPHELLEAADLVIIPVSSRHVPRV